MAAPSSSTRVNTLWIPGPAGYRQLELWHGDLLDWPGADVLCVSIHPGDLEAIEGTVAAETDGPFLWQQLLRRGANLLELRDAAELRLEQALGLWISEPLDGDGAERILCVHRVGRDRAQLQQTFASVFAALAVLEALSIEIGVVVLPLLGAGGFRRDPEDVASALIEASRTALGRLSTLERVVIIERDEERLAAVTEAVDRQLGRPRKSLADSKIFPLIKQELLEHVGRAHQRAVEPDVFVELREALDQPNPPAALLAASGRKLAEHLADELGGQGKDLATRIEDLRNRGVPRWIVGYLHVLRQLGNELVHYTPGAQYNLSHEDLAAAAVCLMRVLDFANQQPGR